MVLHLTHWGTFEAEGDGQRLTEVRPWKGDPEPQPLIGNIASAQHHPVRIDRPHVRAGWAEHGPGAPGRGDEPFVPVSWETALELLSAELRRVYGEHGPRAVFGGSYGWGSAGRFHHAQSQVHRFLNSLGGYVRSVGSYSYGAAEALTPHVIGNLEWLLAASTSWPVLARHTELVVAFGGLSEKNSVVAPGGIGRHEQQSWVKQARARGCRFVSVSPLADDDHAEAETEWIAPRPGSDAAMMLALAYVLDAEGLADHDFLDRCTVGYPKFARYLRGESDGVAKTPEWAEAISGVPVARLVELAREMARSRTMIMVSWSLQRARFGEQPLWLGVVLAAMLGQFGLPGGGFGHGYGSSSDVGQPRRIASAPSLPQGQNGIDEFIPVARIADLLLNPGQEYDYNGERRVYPNIRLVYWCGGNPFHHHQDLARLREAFARPDTVVVHEPFWTATARHADIVLPSTMSIERDDFGAGRKDSLFFPMHALTEPHADARDDYTVFTELAKQLGVADRFTEGRDAQDWLRHLYTEWRDRLGRKGHELPSFDEFWDSDVLEIPVPDRDQVLLAEFRADPQGHPLSTPSGKIEIFSETIDGFGYPDCPGHPVWLEPEEWLGGAQAEVFPLHLIANQPKAKLHSQLDMGEHSQSTKIHGREPARMNPADAAARGLADGAVVRVFNNRGSCLAGLVLSSAVRPGVVQLSTGAWYDPDPADPSFCRHGNPNVLTGDVPTSKLGQGSTGQHALVQVEPYTDPAPPLTVLGPPAITTGPPG
ncbi:molybdopterin guanine dinucleotide-containing S/N-oxide reductase [Amycolatopsis nigrescens]|uniref:molybdopterin guanine dinucleotide-containing S/N-oxide reductase n=1 Tax=Amycolatopsis nigrescens TaxID=381445 RepID=UPI00036B8052|nr:molybdopterin guanine dinucleotide-containing S/N-oxide reductase [Amycolatopsis nigrescens]